VVLSDAWLVGVVSGYEVVGVDRRAADRLSALLLG
jgi:hypothetical protein